MPRRSDYYLFTSLDMDLFLDEHYIVVKKTAIVERVMLRVYQNHILRGPVFCTSIVQQEEASQNY